MLGALIFAATYIAISARRLGWLRLDRPGAVLVGAVACVLCGTLGPDQALSAIDARTLVMLFGMMGMGAFLDAEGFLDRAATALAARAATPQRLLGFVVWASGLASALITNDAVCVLAASLVVGLIRRLKLSPTPFLLALATAANTGSVATLTGNPQNMLCESLANLSYPQHLLWVGPVAVVGLLLNHGLLAWVFRRELQGKLERVDDDVKVFTPASMFVLAVIASCTLLYTMGTDLAWTSVAGLALLLVVQRHEPNVIWSRIDWSILLFFCGLFVVVQALVASGVTEWVFAHVPVWQNTTGAWFRLAAIFMVGSSVVSNVPFIVVIRDFMNQLPDPRLGWEMLAMVSTFAGNLTLLGSAANIIVAEKGRPVGGLGFWQHLRVGLPLSLITTLFGTWWLVYVAR